MRVAAVLAGLTVLCAWGYAAEKAPPVARWTFDADDAAGLRVLDASGNENHGQLRGGQWTPSGAGHAMRFTEHAHHVDLGNPPSLDITGPLTLELWLRPEEVPDWEVGIAGKAIRSYGLTFYKDSRCYWYISGGGNKCSVSLPTGLWIHIVGTFDGTELRLYANGALVDSRKSDFEKVTHDTSFHIGRIRQNVNSNALTNGFRGLVDDVRVYDRALSTEEVRAHFNVEAEQYDGPSSSDEFLLQSYCYPEQNRIYADVDCTGLFPKPDELTLTVEWRRVGSAEVLQKHETVLTSDSMRVRDLLFEATSLTKGDYELVATIQDQGKIRSTQTVAFTLPFASRVPAPSATATPPLASARTRPEYDFALGVDGGFHFGPKGKPCPVASSFSFPRGGANALGAPVADGHEKAWKPKAKRVDEAHYEVTAKGAFYALHRDIELLPGRVLVKDTFTNIAKAPVGIIINNHFDACSRKSLTNELRPNPTLFLSMPDHGLGMVALDDVYLEQYDTYFANARGGIRTQKFALDAGASYTLEWAVYLNATGDYYDFLNDVRTDEGLNRPIAGSFAFVDRREVPTKEYVERRGVGYASIGCLGNPPDDPGLSIEGVEFVEYPQECALLKKTFAETRAQYPGMQTMFHIAHSLYTTNRPDELFGGARTLNSAGQQTMYGGDNEAYYSKYFSEENVKAGYRWFIFYPTMDNAFGPAMLKAIDYMLEEVGCTSMFADGYTHGYGGRFTYDRWDGHTADIDPKTKTITRKYASVNLMAQDVLAEAARKVEAKGGVVICNSYPGTRTVHRENVLYCIESASGDAQLVRLHLVPGIMALGNHIRLKGGNVRDLYDDIRSKLHYGGLYFYYGEEDVPHAMPTTQMFPITPTELHQGWVKGKERIITAIPGVYGWPGQRNLHMAYRWDGRGTPVDHNYVTTVDAESVRTAAELRPHELVVIKHIPVAAETAQPVNLVVRQYDEEGLRIAAHGNGELALTAASGDFPIEAGAKYTVKIGERSQQVAAKADGTLALTCAIGGETEITVSK